MVNKIFSATFALALLLTQVAHALPQASPSGASPTPSPVAPGFSPSMSAPSSTASIPPSPSAPPTAPAPSLPIPIPLRATFDTTFDNREGSMNSVACSNGEFGLAAKFPTFGDVPSFPFIGGAFDIKWNSPNCGSCWDITNPSTGVSIQMTAIDTSDVGFNLAQEAFEKLTKDDTHVGVIDVVAVKLSRTPCGET